METSITLRKCPAMHEANSVCVVTVTYGNRFKLLRQVIQSVLALGVGKVLVVDNASEAKSRKQLRELERASQGKVEVVYSPENLGSAGGYKAGLEHASRDSTCEFIWLLDDDNQPEAGALNELQVQYSDLSVRHTQGELMLLAMREDSPYLQVAARSRSKRKGFPRKSSFLRFHVLDIPQKLLKLTGARIGQGTDALVQKFVDIPFGPYGGLYFHKRSLAKIGYPNERFFVYADDFEYTYRLTRSGGKLFLIPASKIRDMDQSWNTKSEGKFWTSHLLLSDSDTRVFYLVRNRTYFDRFFLAESYLLYQLNKWMFLMILFGLALRYRRLIRFQHIVKAIREGERNCLGRLDQKVK